MRLSFRAGFVAACLLAPSIAAADDPGWYVGFDVGAAKATTVPGALRPLPEPNFPSNDPGLAFASSGSTGSTSTEVEGGYWFNSYVGLQAGFLDLGSFARDFHTLDSDSKVCIGAVCGSDSDDAEKVKASGVAVAVTGRWPLSEDFDLLGRAGVFASHTTFEEEETVDFQTVDSAHLSKDDFASDFGAGLGWKFMSHWEAQLRWDQYAHLGGGDFTTFNVRVSSLSLQYHF
ncbi:MAG TPA: outer membrane beta-barrel protein [Gammaproteobacteria bacterium]|jgi:hypothetical protein